jgi:hypothetical protein
MHLVAKVYTKQNHLHVQVATVIHCSSHIDSTLAVHRDVLQDLKLAKHDKKNKAGHCHITILALRNKWSQPRIEKSELYQFSKPVKSTENHFATVICFSFY